MSFSDWMRTPNTPTKPTSLPTNSQPPSNEWQLACDRCTAQFRTLSSAITRVRSLIQKIGSASDSVDYRQDIRQQLQQTKQLSDALSQDIRQMQAMVAAASDPTTRSARKCTVTKMNRDLQESMQVYQTLTREWMLREKQPLPAKTSGPSVSSGLPSTGAGGQTQAMAFAPYTRQELLDMEQRLDWQDRMIDEREEAIMGIQRGVLEVNEMFRDIHALALAQAPLVDSIEQHIEHSRINVEKGVEKLEEASRAQRKFLFW